MRESLYGLDLAGLVVVMDLQRKRSGGGLEIEQNRNEDCVTTKLILGYRYLDSLL